MTMWRLSRRSKRIEGRGMREEDRGSRDASITQSSPLVARPLPLIVLVAACLTICGCHLTPMPVSGVEPTAASPNPAIQQVGGSDMPQAPGRAVSTKGGKAVVRGQSIEKVHPFFTPPKEKQMMAHARYRVAAPRPRSCSAPATGSTPVRPAIR